MFFPSHIFKAYDIRGLVDGELSERLAYAIGRGFIRILREQGTDLTNKKIVVGRDMRPTSPLFEEAVVAGILAEGATPVLIGMASTPLFNFSVAHYLEHAGGIMITASHNPAEYNGFKMAFENGLPLGKNTGMDRLRTIVETLIQEPSQSSTTPSVEYHNTLPDYYARIFSLVDPKALKPLRVVIDAGNGMANATFPELVKQLPISAEFLFLEPDGTFPHHEANPLKTETLTTLQERVRATHADLGFALDGDCDRIGLVDDQGSVVEASYVSALVGLEVLRNNNNTGHMWYDLRSSMIVPEVWSQHGATTEKCPVGHAHIKKILKEKGGIFASELSLHQYFPSMYDVESSDLSFLYILQALSRENKPLSTLIAPFKKYVHSGEINFEVHDKDTIIKNIEAKYAPEALEISHLDGLYMKFAWGWFSVRSSNTEPVLRLNLETRTSAVLETKKNELTNHIMSPT